MGTIIWTESALKDLKEIKKFIAQDSKIFADYFIDKLFKASEILKIYPKIGKRFKNIHNLDYRMIIFKKYRIIYKEINENISIIRVLHSSRILDV
jgi:toxin ParE1/3/4